MLKHILPIAAIAGVWFLCTSQSGPRTPVYPENGGGADPSLVLKDVRTASDKIVIALFTSDVVDLDGVDISDPGQWKVGRKEAIALNKWVTEAEGSEHRVYIEEPQELYAPDSVRKKAFPLQGQFHSLRIHQGKSSRIQRTLGRTFRQLRHLDRRRRFKEDRRRPSGILHS